MLTIHKRLLLDEAMNPLAVQIDYADWVEVARRFGNELRGGEIAAL